MKIIAGEKTYDLPDKPRTYEGGCKGKEVYLTIDWQEVTLASYSTVERAHEVASSLCRAYLDNAAEFVLPPE